MTWTTFLLSLAILYSIYYSLNISFDLLKSRRLPAKKEDHETLFFEDNLVPELVVLQEKEIQTQTGEEELANRCLPITLQSSGGVTVEQLISLAKANLIEYTRGIPYG